MAVIYKDMSLYGIISQIYPLSAIGSDAVTPRKSAITAHR